MSKLNLFGEEVTKIIEKKKESRIKKEDWKWERKKSRERLEELEKQDETGWSDIDINLKGKEVNMPLVKNHIKYYTEKLNEQRKPYQEFLNRWKKEILDYCAEKGQEVDLIWFNESVPFDVSVNIRMKGHRCWYQCVSFRFQDEHLKAYDSHFGGGTSFIDRVYGIMREDNYRYDVAVMKEIMDKVFNKECSDSSWEEGNDEKKEHKIDEMGWLDD